MCAWRQRMANSRVVYSYCYPAYQQTIQSYFMYCMLLSECTNVSGIMKPLTASTIFQPNWYYVRCRFDVPFGSWLIDPCSPDCCFPDVLYELACISCVSCHQVSIVFFLYRPVCIHLFCPSLGPAWIRVITHVSLWVWPLNVWPLFENTYFTFFWKKTKNAFFYVFWNGTSKT